MVTLEHHDRPVEFGHVQTQVICPDLLIGRVREDLHTNDMLLVELSSD